VRRPPAETVASPFPAAGVALRAGWPYGERDRLVAPVGAVVIDPGGTAAVIPAPQPLWILAPQPLWILAPQPL
jgi:hypothetical protein